MKLLAVCLDSAERRIVDDMIRAGDLPNLARLRGQGAWAPLERDGAYRAETAHLPILTGADPERLGYWGQTLFDPSTYECWMQGTYLGPPFYARRDLKVIVFDFPQMSLAADVDGVQVSAWGAHSPQFPPTSSPAGLFDEITRRFGPHPAARSEYHPSWHNERFMRDLADALVEGAGRRARIVRWLMGEHPDWELFLTGWGETHTAGHHFLHGVDPSHPFHLHRSAPLAAELLHQVYRAVDDAVGEVADALGGDTRSIVFAAHGAKPNAGDVPGLVLFPELLFRQHTGRRFLRLEDGVTGDDWVQPPPHRHVMEYLRQRADVRVLADSDGGAAERFVAVAKHRLPPRAVSAARQLKGLLREGSLPTVWHHVDRRPFAERAMVPGAAENDIVRAGSIARWYRPFWPWMRAFSLPSFSDAHFRINVVGREAQGLVPADGFRRACEELADDLRAVRDGRTGQPLVEDIRMPRGDDPHALPGLDSDLVVSIATVTDRIEHPTVGMVGPAPLMRPGEHSSSGWTIVGGHGIRAGEQLPAGDPVDLCRTMLALLDRDDDSLGGRPLVELQQRSQLS